MHVPSSELGPPTPSPASECAPPPGTKGGAHSPAGEGVGESQFQRLEKRLSTLSTLWVRPSTTLLVFLRTNLIVLVRFISYLSMLFGHRVSKFCVGENVCSCTNLPCTVYPHFLSAKLKIVSVVGGSIVRARGPVSSDPLSADNIKGTRQGDVLSDFFHEETSSLVTYSLLECFSI